MRQRKKKRVGACLLYYYYRYMAKIIITFCWMDCMIQTRCFGKQFNYTYDRLSSRSSNDWRDHYGYDSSNVSLLCTGEAKLIGKNNYFWCGFENLGFLGRKITVFVLKTKKYQASTFKVDWGRHWQILFIIWAALRLMKEVNERFSSKIGHKIRLETFKFLAKYLVDIQNP